MKLEIVLPLKIVLVDVFVRRKPCLEHNFFPSSTGWPKKVSHYQVSSLKTVIKATFFIIFDYKMSKRM